MKRELLDEAYRKLKGSVYLDKTLPYLRAEIAKFENDNFEERMSGLLESFSDDAKWQALRRRVLASVKAYTFPKKIRVESKDDCEPLVISNVCAETACVEKYNNFIDLSVEGHIIGVFWILLVGYKIDRLLSENCFGNRLCDKLVFANDRVSESPNLFKPYYGQYESWRNKGLKYAKKVVSQDNQSVIITMLDLTRYYYNINFTKELYDSVTKTKADSDELYRINELIYDILKRYSVVLGDKERVFLPIGFLPSNILSNVYLQGLDMRIANSRNTVYYGRYVDDMILVTKIEAQSKLKYRISKNGISEVSSFMLKRLQYDEIIESNVDNTIGIIGYKGLNVQRDKFRFFYVDKNGYDTIIEKIKSDISRNTSEFNFLPEKAVSEINGDILQFEREDTVNKLRAVNGVSIDKYALSKAIGKNVKMSQYAEAKAIDVFIRNIDQLLNHQELISNYTQWEGVITYYVLNEKWNDLIGFALKVVSALKGLDEETYKRDEYSYLNAEGIYSVGDTLVKYFFSCLARPLAIVWGTEIEKALEKISLLFSQMDKYRCFSNTTKIKQMTSLRKYFCNSRMINCSLLPISIEECMSTFAPNDKVDGTVRFYRLEEYFSSEGKHRFSKKKGKYKPYISSPFDILYTLLIKEIKSMNSILSSDISCVKYVCDHYSENFVSTSETFLNQSVKAETFDDSTIISVETQDNEVRNGKYRIAVANVKMKTDDIEDILDGKKRDISSRCIEISKIVNEAIRYKSDVLVFPEAYIPITFLPVIQSKAAAHNMVIIGGLEHVRRGNIVYNLTVTLLPIVNTKARYTIPFFHTKVYYSPKEVEIMKKRHFIPALGSGHTLFKWKDLSFVTFCCYELTSLEERSKYKREADIVFGVEWNKDTYYFSNIIESLSRDRCCFCAQSNMSEFGDSRIVQPTKSVLMNIARVKGGVNGTVIIDEIDVEALRKHKVKSFF